MQLYFIRHAQSVNNALWSETGSNKSRNEDPELTELGIKQARAVAEFLKAGNPQGGRLCNGEGETGFGITHLYCSLMLRSVKTASLISETLGLPLHAWIELHEQGGIYLEDETTGKTSLLPGRSRKYFETHYPRMILPAEMVDTGWWNNKPLETPDQSLKRALDFLINLKQKHGGTEDRVAIISHGGFYNDLLVALLDIHRNGGWFSIFNTGITRINFMEDRFDIIYQNRTDHLTSDMIS